MYKKSNQRIGDLDCVIVEPENCESPKAVCLLCHGYGAPSTDLVSLAPELMGVGGPLAEIVYVFPAAPIELDPMFDARAWWPIDMEKLQQMMMLGQTREMKGESPELLPARSTSIAKLIDELRITYRLPASKIIIGGFSQGAMLTTDVALKYPELLGGLIVWSGSLIDADNWQELAKKQSPLTVVQSHGRTDPILPYTGAEELRDMLLEAGHSVHFCEFGGQHSIPMEAIQMSVKLIGEVASKDGRPT